MTLVCFPVPVETAGKLWIMPCPKAADFDALAQLRVACVLSMLPVAEARELGMADEASFCARTGMDFLTHPIDDFALPDDVPFTRLISDLESRLESGKNLAVHCRAGIGRSGMVAACILVAFGNDATTAQASVSKARGVSIPDTVEQGKFITSFAQDLKNVPDISI